MTYWFILLSNMGPNRIAQGTTLDPTLVLLTVTVLVLAGLATFWFFRKR